MLSTRVPVLADADTIAALHVSTWQEAYGHLLPSDFFTEGHRQQRRDMWRDILTENRPTWSTRVAEVDGEIVGFAFIGPGQAEESEPSPPRDRQVYMIYVAKSHYGSGVGQALLDAGLGDDPAQLWVAEENPRAIAFYRRNGFEFDGVQKTDPMARIVDLRMLR